MRTMHFKSCRISSGIPLEKLVSFFRMQRSSIRKHYVILGETELALVLKTSTGSRRAYLFEFGCITFVDFEEFEIQLFIEFLTGMADRIDYAMVAKFADSHTLEIDDNQEYLPWRTCPQAYHFEDSVVPIISIILAKSVALDKIEKDVGNHLDESEKYIDYLQKGRLRINRKSLTAFISGFLKFEYESIRSIRIYDRSFSDNNTGCKEIYDSLSGFYELNDRFDVLQGKIKSLHNTMKTYNALSYQRAENRLYLFEIVLLFLFPLATTLRFFFNF